MIPYSPPRVMTHIPLVDVGAAFGGGGAAARQEAALAMRDACRHIGFFYLRGHGVPTGLCDAVLDAARRLFALPDAAKAACNARNWPCRRGFEPLGNQILDEGSPPDLKESFYVGRDLGTDHAYVRDGIPNYGPNQWPAADVLAGDARATIEEYFATVRALEGSLYGLLALSLELPETHFASALADSAPMLRLIHYPPHPVEAPVQQLGAGAHTDWGGLTVLLQDAVGGLEVQNRAGDWLRATPIPGTFVVNLGELISRWTNDLYQSQLHRVRNVGPDRYSVAYFSNPDHFARIECLPSCTDADHPPKFAPCTAGEHIEALYRLTYGRAEVAAG